MAKKQKQRATKVARSTDAHGRRVLTAAQRAARHRCGPAEETTSTQDEQTAPDAEE